VFRNAKPDYLTS